MSIFEYPGQQVPREQNRIRCHLKAIVSRWTELAPTTKWPWWFSIYLKFLTGWDPDSLFWTTPKSQMGSP